VKAMAASRNDEYKRRYRRYSRLALLGSLLLHVAVVLLFRNALLIPESPFSAAGPRAGDDRAAAGGGMELVNMQIVEPQSEPVVDEVVPVEVVEPEPEVPVPVEDPRPQVVATVAMAVTGVAAAGQGLGRDTGPGLENGTGRGDGGTTEEGRFRVVPPSPRGLILPPSDRPGKLRGMEVEVWVFVAVSGKVVSDSTRVAPSTGDRRFENRLKSQAAEWVFEPARRDGQPVPEWFRYTIIL